MSTNFNYKKRSLIDKTKPKKKLKVEDGRQIINFNSKAKQYYELSNFYGGAEKEYMKARFIDKEVKDLFDKFETVNKEEFLYYLQVLQPKKKFTPKQLDYWVRDGEPIRGILSKLAGTAVRDTPTGRNRLKILKQLTKLDVIKIQPDLSSEEKRSLMLNILRTKYSKPEFKTILLSTGNAILHEIPLRGKPNNWTYKNGVGGDWLGKLLMQVRDELSESNIIDLTDW